MRSGPMTRPLSARREFGKFLKRTKICVIDLAFLEIVRGESSDNAAALLAGSHRRRRVDDLGPADHYCLNPSSAVCARSPLTCSAFESSKYGNVGCADFAHLRQRFRSAGMLLCEPEFVASDENSESQACVRS